MAATSDTHNFPTISQSSFDCKTNLFEKCVDLKIGWDFKWDIKL